MAAPTLRTLGRAARAVAGWLVLAVGLFFLAGWIGSSIPRNAGWTEPDAGVEIMVETNGVHTALVLPLVTPQKDWRAVFPAAHIPASDRPYTHVSVSWGERAVFLETPTWADLSARTVLRVLFGGGEGLLHVYHYVRPAPGSTLRPLRLREAEYARLVAKVEASFPEPTRARAHRGYGRQDVFYEAPGRYTINNTCNQWASDVLAAAGVRTGWWTPFAGGVMKWVPPAERLATL